MFDLSKIISIAWNPQGEYYSIALSPGHIDMMVFKDIHHMSPVTEEEHEFVQNLEWNLSQLDGKDCVYISELNRAV